MGIGDRLNYLREKRLKMSQEDFGEKIGVSRFSVSNYESGKRNLTDRVITDICREFSVNESWLRTGSGDPFELLSSQEQLMKYTAMLLKNKDSAIVSAIQAFIITYEQLDEENKLLLEKIALQYAENLKKS